jgi:hypothetical protein
VLCPQVGEVTLLVDTRAVANGEHELTMTVTDAAGSSQPTYALFDVLNPVPTPTATPTPTPTATATATATAAPTATATPAAPPPVAQPKPAPTAVPARPLSTRERVRIPARLKFSRRGSLALSTSCPATASAPCRLRLTLAARGVSLATGSATAAPGRRAQVVLRLTSAGRRALARNRTLAAKLTLAGAAPADVRLRR